MIELHAQPAQSEQRDACRIMKPAVKYSGALTCYQNEREEEGGGEREGRGEEDV